ncbi:MAG TPA: glycosyltransferase [Verrucomicrobiae bacterium]|jgi:biofilm PGA synthesis N-glycosyltransferase PgaC|nr:glycosyltransferase [Verrucomicrobiae bacterium]
MNSIRYVIITPVRNEEAFMQRTIDSVVAQTMGPIEWIIVDDGSTDKTPEIIDRAASKHPWIRPLHRADRGFRKSGGGVMEAFHDGYGKLKTKQWDYLVKLDGDLTFAPDYFEKCFAHFAANPKLGIGGGLVCNEIGGQRVLDSKEDPKFHVRGATKIYSRACWEGIGGLIKSTGWDTHDEVKANMLGWKTCTFNEIPIIHHRETGGADGAWRNYFKNGRANYVVGYHPVFMLGKCIKRLFRRPYIKASLALWCGFVSGYVSSAHQQVKDRALIRYLRSQQLSALLGRKCLWKAYEV